MKIKKIEFVEDDLNYWDITVPSYHNFVLSNGAVVHNCGCGTGFSVQKQHIKQLPTIAKHTKGKKKFVIPDSIEGWADAVGLVVNSYFEMSDVFPESNGYKIELDYSQIRPEGALISGGFRAPGPKGLERSINKIVELIETRLESDGFKIDEFAGKLRPIDAYDIIMHMSDAVLSGGVRRCLPEYYSVKMFDGSYKKISDIVEGDLISFGGKSYPVSNTFKNGTQDLLKINTATGFHISTPNHKWLVYDHELKDTCWVEAKNLTEKRYSFVKER